MYGSVIQHTIPQELIIRAEVVSMFAENCYILGCSKTRKAVIIDPGDEAPRILDTVNNESLEVIAIWNTHGHIDHIGANSELVQKLNVPLLFHKDEKKIMDSVFNKMFGGGLGLKEMPSADKYIEDGEDLQVGDLQFKVLHTPGHTPGEVCFYGHGVLFAGDVLFNQGIGRTDLPQGDMSMLLKSIKEKLFTLPPETIVLPGHGPSTTIGDEQSSNPFVGNRAIF